MFAGLLASNRMIDEFVRASASDLTGGFSIIKLFKLLLLFMPILLNYSLMSFISHTSWFTPMLTADTETLWSYESYPYPLLVFSCGGESLTISGTTCSLFLSMKYCIVSIYLRYKFVRLLFWVFREVIRSCWSSITSYAWERWFSSWFICMSLERIWAISSLAY